MPPLSMKSLESNPWKMLEWESCRNVGAGYRIGDLIDDKIFFEETDAALRLSFIFQELCNRLNDQHLLSRSESIVGSAYRTVPAPDLARKYIGKALKTCKCPICQANAHRRMGIVETYDGNIPEAIGRFEQAIERSLNLSQRELCMALISRATVHRISNSITQGFDDISQAAGLATKDLPSRTFTAISVNIISFASVLEDYSSIERAKEILNCMRKLLKGKRTHSRNKAELKWLKGLLLWREGKITEAIEAIDYGISHLRRQNMTAQLRVACADVAMIRASSPAINIQQRHLVELAAKCLEMEHDEAVIKLLRQIVEQPDLEKIIKWREALAPISPIPIVTRLGQKMENHSDASADQRSWALVKRDHV